jgi:hypothetical protein
MHLRFVKRPATGQENRPLSVAKRLANLPLPLCHIYAPSTEGTAP